MYCSGHSSGDWQTTCTYIRSLDNINGKQMVDKFVIMIMLWFSNCNQYFRKRPRPCRFWKMFYSCFLWGSTRVLTSTHDLGRSSTTHILTFGIPCNGELFFWKTLRCPVPGNPRDPTCRRLFSDTSNHGPNLGWTAVQSEMYVKYSMYVHFVYKVCMHGRVNMYMQ